MSERAREGRWAGGREIGWLGDQGACPRARARAGTGRRLGLVDKWHSGTLNWSLESATWD